MPAAKNTYLPSLTRHESYTELRESFRKLPALGNIGNALRVLPVSIILFHPFVIRIKRKGRGVPDMAAK